MVTRYKEENGKFIKLTETVVGYRDLRRLADKVELILETYPATRDDDHLLIQFVYKNHYLVDNEPFHVITNKISHGELPPFESVIRCRRKLQENGQWLGTKKKERLETEQSVRDQINEWKD